MEFEQELGLKKGGQEPQGVVKDDGRGPDKDYNTCQLVTVKASRD